MGFWAAVAPLSCLRILFADRRRTLEQTPAKSSVQRGVYVVNEAFGGMMQRCQEVRANPTTAYRMRQTRRINRKSTCKRHSAR